MGYSLSGGAQKAKLPLISDVHLVLLNFEDGRNWSSRRNKLQNVNRQRILNLPILEVVMGLILFRDYNVHL